MAGMSRQNFYARRQASSRGEVDLGLALDLVGFYRKQHPRLGVRKIYHLIKSELESAGVKMGRDRLFSELGKAGLLVERKASEWPKTTHFRPYLPVFKNRIKALKMTRRNQVWMADITYIRTKEGFKYLSLITDRWSRKILGAHLSCSLETEGSLKALKIALDGLQGDRSLIHHSDRGGQYASHAYVKRLKEEKISISMTEVDHCAENAMAERMNGILKQEYFLSENFETKKEAKRAVRQAVVSYNNGRPHTSLKMKTPEQVHRM